MSTGELNAGIKTCNGLHHGQASLPKGGVEIVNASG